MSFASDVRKELIKHYTKAVHCRKAELAAIFLFAGKRESEETLILSCDDQELAKSCQASLKKLFSIDAVERHTARSQKLTGLAINGREEIEKLGALLPLLQNEEPELQKNAAAQANLDRLTAKTCCQRAFLRGAFVTAGTISDPEKHYHLEFVCGNLFLADYICKILQGFGISAKISKRRGRYIAYIKEGVDIADLLNVMEAHVSLMSFENIRIVREMRGNVNRKVNCETANIEKTVTAAMRQIEDIDFINRTIGLGELDASLRQIAQARLDHPDIPLSKLGCMMDPPVGKSGVNHRLRKISQIAEQLRAEYADGESYDG